MPGTVQVPDPARAVHESLMRLRTEAPRDVQDLVELRKRHERRTREVLEPDAR